MNILCFAERYLPSLGGVETLCRDLSHALHQRGHRVTVITDRYHPDLPVEGNDGPIKIHRLDMHRAMLSRNPVALMKILREFESLRRDIAPDVTHLHLSGPCAYFPLVHPQTPTVTTLHNPLGYAPGVLTGNVMNASHAIVAISDFVQQKTVDAYPASAPKLRLIANALPTPVRPVAPLPPLSPLKLMAVGRVVEDKGFDLLLDALAALEGQPIQLDLIGDGPELETLKTQASNLGLTSVSFLGSQQQSAVFDAMDRSHVVVVPSRWEECFGLVAVEAMQRGRAVVAAATGALPEIVEHEKTGLLFERYSSSDLGTQLRTLLQQPDLCASLGAEAASSVQRRFPWEGFVAAHETLYQESLCN